MSHNFNSNVSVHRIRIPSQVTVKQISAGFVVSESSNFLTQTRSSTLLQFVGPLGSIEMNLQKIDKYGLSFFKISHTASQFCNLQKKEILSLHSAANNEAYLELYVKKMAPTKSLTIAPKFKIVDSIIQKNDGLFQTQSNLNNYPASQISAGLLGTLTSLCKNALEGVSIGFVVYLELVGVGYKANIIQTPCSLSRTKVPLVASGIERKPLTSATTLSLPLSLYGPCLGREDVEHVGVTQAPVCVCV